MKSLSVIIVLVIILSGCSLKTFQNKKQPNILFIMADDCTHNVLGCYGGLNAKTPNIDKLATEGLLFNKAYVGMSMCAPCRQELYSGLYPLQSGCAWNHSQSKPGTKSIFHYLTDLGYRVGISGKKDVTPKEVYPYINVPGFVENCVLDEEPLYDCSGIEKFMGKDHKQPFCLFVCSTNPHAPWTTGDPSLYLPGKIKLPATLGDTPEVREAFSRYLAEVTYFDQQVGDILESLKKLNLDKNTLVMLSTEQGWQLSGAKWTNWDIGVHTGLIARWPGKIKPGIKTDALVQFADITPTFINLAGGNPIKGLNGTSFMDVLIGTKNGHRKYVYCMHNNVPEGKPYPIRSIRDKDFHYIMNLIPDSTYFEKHLEGGAHGDTWWDSWKKAAKNDNNAKFLVERFYHRPAEELYKVENDPNEFNNLAGKKEYDSIQKKLREELLKWMDEQKDPGIPVDTEKAWEKKYWQ